MLEVLCRSPYWAAERFFLYHAIGTEAETRHIIAALLAAGKRVFLPRICGREMAAVPYTGVLTAGAYNIPAPPEGEDSPCDVAIAPLLAVDGEGYRLGYGGGFYDRYFASHPAVKRVGLCFAAQRTDKLPHGKHDVPLQAVITEEGVFSLGALPVRGSAEGKEKRGIPMEETC